MDAVLHTLRKQVPVYAIQRIYDERRCIANMPSAEVVPSTIATGPIAVRTYLTLDLDQIPHQAGQWLLTPGLSPASYRFKDISARIKRVQNLLYIYINDLQIDNISEHGENSWTKQTS